MGKHRNELGFTAVEGLLIVLVVAVIGFGGYYVWHTQKNTGRDQTASTTKSSTASPATNSQAQQPSDNDLIVAAVKSYAGAGGSQQDATVDTSKIVISGDNASGQFSTPDAGGASFIAHKTNGTWQVVWEGQQAPDASVGTKYGLPASWYTTN